jgi:hypothetical protein
MAFDAMRLEDDSQEFALPGGDRGSESAVIVVAGAKVKAQFVRNRAKGPRGDNFSHGFLLVEIQA